MRVVKTSFRNITSILIFVSPLAVAQVSPITGELIRVKEIAESTFKNGLERSIATRLDPTHFSVSVEFSLVQIVSQTNNPLGPPLEDIKLPRPSIPQDGGAFLPSLMGLVESEEMIRSFEKKLNELAAQQRQTQVTLNSQMQAQQVQDVLARYAISSATISLGLVKEIGDDYRSTLRQWLERRIGGQLNIPVNVDIATIQKPQENIQERTLLDWYRDLEMGLMTLVLSLTAVFAVILWFTHKFLKFRHERQMQKEADEAALRLQAEQSAMEESRENRKRDEAAKEVEKHLEIGSMDSQDLAQAREKLAGIFDVMGDKRRDLVVQLTATSERGRLKVAILLDAWMHFVSKSGREIVNTSWLDELQEVRIYRFQMLNAIEKLRLLSDHAKKDLVQEVYWDVLSFRANNGNLVTEPFSNINELSNTEVYSLFLDLDQKQQSFLFLFLNQGHQNYIKNSVTTSEFSILIRREAEMIYLSPIEIETITDSIYEAYAVKFAGRVNFIKHFERSLSILDASQEIQLLRDTKYEFREKGIEIQKLIVSLAFFDEVRAEVKKRILAVADPDEIMTLISLFPESKNEILNLCSPMVREMVEQDMNLIDIQDKNRERELLNSLKQKLQHLIENKEVIYESMYQEESIIENLQRMA